MSGLLFYVPDTAGGEAEVAELEGDTEVPRFRTEDLVDSDSSINKYCVSLLWENLDIGANKTTLGHQGEMK